MPGRELVSRCLARRQAQRVRAQLGRAGQQQAALRRPGPEHCGLEQLAGRTEGHARLELAAAGGQQRQAQLAGCRAGRGQQGRLADPGRAADRDHPAVPAARIG